MEIDDLAASSGVPGGRLSGLEEGSADSADPNEVISDLRRVAACLGLPATSLVEATVAAWAVAYSSTDADAGSVDTQPFRPEWAASSEGGEVTATLLSPRPGDTAAPAPGLGAIARRELSGDGGVAGRAGSRRGVRRALVWGVRAAAVANIVAAGLLVAAQFGVFSSPADSIAGPPRGAPRGAPVAVRMVSSTGASASYQVGAPTFRLTVTSDRPSWVQMGPLDAPPSFAGLIEPGTAHTFTESAPLSVQIGAGGTSVTLSAGRTVVTLQPPQAPFTFQLEPV